VRLINLPWLNHVNADWLQTAIAGCASVVTLDNHQISGGQGLMIAAMLGQLGHESTLRHLGVVSIPRHGLNDEVLRSHGLDAAGIENAVLEMAGANSEASTCTG
jgi:transketolase